MDRLPWFLGCLYGYALMVICLSFMMDRIRWLFGCFSLWVRFDFWLAILHYSWDSIVVRLSLCTGLVVNLLYCIMDMIRWLLGCLSLYTGFGGWYAIIHYGQASMVIWLFCIRDSFAVVFIIMVGIRWSICIMDMLRWLLVYLSWFTGFDGWFASVVPWDVF